MKKKTRILIVLAIIYALTTFYSVTNYKNRKTASANSNIEEESFELDPDFEVESDENVICISDAGITSNQNPYEAVETAIRNRESKISFTDELYDLTWADLEVMDYGSFWVESFSCAHYKSGDQDINEYVFQYYDLTSEEIEIMKGQIDSEISSIASCIPEGATDYEKALIVHDSLISKITYDTTLSRDYRHNLYGLVTGYCVCSGYACCYFHVISAISDMPIQIVRSSDHSWNRIGLSHIDVCWDDYDMNNPDGTPLISYKYFGMSFDQINSIEHHEIVDYSFNSCSTEVIIPYFFEYKGYTLSEYSYDSLVNIIAVQCNNGVSLPTVYFTNTEAYEECKADMQTRFWDLVSDTGYTGPCTSLYQDDESLTWGFN